MQPDAFGGIRRALVSFIRDQSGNIAFIFACTAAVILCIAGLALDYGNALRMRSMLQEAADASVLAAAQRSDLNDDAVAAFAESIFAKNASRLGDIKHIQYSFNRSNDGSVHALISGGVATRLMEILGTKNLDVSVKSSALPDTGLIEVALVLDNTGSMNGARLDTLKTASNLLIDKLYQQTGAAQKVRVSLVPFGQYVNVGMGYRAANWLNVPADYSTTQNVCWDDYPVVSRTNCHTVTNTAYNDGVPYTYDSEQCDIVYGSPVHTCADQTSNYVWNGCVGSRAYPEDTSNVTATAASPVPGLLNMSCPSPLQRLTNDVTTIRNQIDAMNAVGETYIPSGLIWGWRTLTYLPPFADGKNQVTNPDVKKALILMTDGANTKSPNYPDHEGGDQPLANSLTSELCTNIKADNIIVFTVAFDVNDAVAVDMLHDCATSSAFAFTADSAAQLSQAFQRIGGILAALRLDQ